MANWQPWGSGVSKGKFGPCVPKFSALGLSRGLWPILVIVARDPSHKGHASRHPLYYEYLQLGVYSVVQFGPGEIHCDTFQISICNNKAGCLLNLYEGVRTLTTSWTPFARMPVYDHQIVKVRVKALQATELVNCVWKTRRWHMPSRTWIFKHETRCSCIGVERLCASPGCLWLQFGQS